MRTYQESILSKWYLIGINDFFLAQYYNYFYKKYGVSKMHDIINIRSVSTNQVCELSEIADKLFQHQDIGEAIVAGDKRNFYDILARHPECSLLLSNHLNKYRGRFGNELKLEMPDLDDDFKRLANLLIMYKTLPIRKEMVKRSTIELSLIDRMYLKRLQRHAVNRENLRLLRSNFFSVLRKLINRIGHVLHENNRLDDPSDIYHIDYKYLFNMFDNAAGMKWNYKQMAVANKQTYLEHMKLDDVPSHFVTINGMMPQMLRDNVDATGTLSGIGCSSGIIRGRVKLFHQPDIPTTSFDILVAQHTDPGWTTLIGMSKGMIIESGGILSHAAIVSRELDIPTVINVKHAMKVLQDGQMVELDGAKGTIKIIEN
jgi:phosphohistidine swiveling domain-containing protein